MDQPWIKKKDKILRLIPSDNCMTVRRENLIGLVDVCIYLFIYLFIHLFIYLFIYSFIHSFKLFCNWNFGNETEK